MYYQPPQQPSDEKVIMMGTTGIHSSEAETVRLCRQRKKILTILIAVEMILYTCSLGIEIFKLANSDGLEKTKPAIQIVSAVFSLAYLAFGLYVTLRQFRVGLLVFAWLGVINLIFVAIAVLMLFIAVLTILANRDSLMVNIDHRMKVQLEEQFNTVSKSVRVGLGEATFLCIAGLSNLILTICMLVFAFKLAKVIKLRKESFIRQ